MRIHQLLFPFLLISALLMAPQSKAQTQYYYDYNAQCRAAYQAFLSLRIKEGKELIAKELKENPKNLIPVFLSNYGDCLPLLFNGSTKEYAELKSNMGLRLTLLEKGDSKSPWFLYCKAGLYFQWAAVRLRFNEYLSGGLELRKSFLLLKENDKKFKEFKYNQVLLGLEEAIAGTIPDNYKWIANILGVKGNLTEGMSKVSKFVKDQNPDAQELKEEAIFYYSFLRFYLFPEKEEVWTTLNQLNLDERNNLVYTFLFANLSLDDNRAENCINILENRNKNSNYLQLPLFDYQMGTALLQENSPAAIRYFKQFLVKYSGRFFEKSAYQKISYYYLINGDLKQAMNYKKKITSVGTLEIDADKQAQRYSKSLDLPNVNLLKAQLFSSGGYFKKASEVLEQTNISKLSGLEEMTEYYYRFGQIQRLLGNKKNSVNYYINALNLGATSKGQYAARAALELALMYEELNQKAKALEYFNKCLSLKNHDFQSSIDQKAKAGINRIGAL